MIWESCMAHEDKQSNLDSAENFSEAEKTTQEQLTDANTEIVALKLQIAWLERSYE